MHRNEGNSDNRPQSRLFFGSGLLVMAISLALWGSVQAQDAAAEPEAEQEEEAAPILEEVVVSGYRKSLEVALDLKKDSVGAVDAIFAEDIADFPDQNLAESLQRIPGITITRDSGEGRNISVRGLSGEFTRVRINGIEAIAATGGEGGPNRGRDFDFNVFASELFNELVVHKTASADLEEGSLGAVIDLNTGRPFNYKEGVTFVVNAQAEYNDLGEDWGPRVSTLFAYHDPDGVWGASASLAYSDNTTLELGQNTVRWQTGAFRKVGGVVCAQNPTNAGCAQVAGAFHPRIPRYGEIRLDRERLGITGGLQFAPSDRTLISLDMLYSELDASRGEKWGEVLFRGNERLMDVLDYTYDPVTNNINSMTVNNAWVRTENFEKAWTTEFYQIGLNVDHEISDTLRFHGLVGRSSSDLNFPYEITFVYDDRDYNGFFYDYTDDKFPVISFGGPDVTDPSIFQLAELRDRPAQVDDTLDSLSLELDWDFHENMSLSFGGGYKVFEFDTSGTIRDTTVCPNLYNCAGGLVGVPANLGESEIYTFPDRTGPGSSQSFAIPDLAYWIQYFDLFNLPARPDLGNIRSVEEKDTSLFMQLNGDHMLGDMQLRYNVGVRWVSTDQSSTGYNSGTQVTVDRSPYSDSLPSANLALSITPDLIWRLSGAEVMTRPGLGNLSPGGSVDAFNYRVSYQNPFLDPTRAKAYDTSLEWYFADEAVLSFAYFYKDIESFPLSSQRTGTYASTGLPLSLLNPTSPAGQCPECIPWTISTIDNGPGGDLDGFEIAFQLPLDAFIVGVPFISNLGIQANYTYVDSKVDYTFGSTIITERLFGLSNDSYNATIYYTNERFEARASYAYRGDFITGTSGTGNRFEGYGPIESIDFSAKFSLTDHFDLTFEALNLGDDYQDRWNDIYTERRYEYDHTGSIYKLGLKYFF